MRGSQKQVNYMSKIINESIGINESLLPQDIEGPQKGQFHLVSFLALAKAAKCLGHALQTTPGLQRRQVRGSIAGTSTGSSNAYVASASLKDRTNLHKQTAANCSKLANFHRDVTKTFTIFQHPTDPVGSSC